MVIKISAKCPLCSGRGEILFQDQGNTYYQCGQCSGAFLDEACHVSREDEKKRYEKHNNDVNDPGYQKFVGPLVRVVQERFTPEHKGLDYGSGTGPVAAMMLGNKGYSVELYDPYFCDNPEVFQKTYDFIICCEVIEHFNRPAVDFEKLRSLLNPGGALVCMTELYSTDTAFDKWYYRNDPTHVFFYHEKTLFWIKSEYGFSKMESKGRLAVFSL